MDKDRAMKNGLMNATVLVAPGKLQMQQLDRPLCPAGGVLVKVEACGICSADVKMAHIGHRALSYPRVLGHEIGGVIVESRHAAYAAGMRVQVAPGLRCGQCRFCRKGADNQCLKREIIGFTRDGGFAEMLAVPLEGALVGQVTQLPEQVDFAAATLAEPLACCLHAQQRAGITAADRVLIIGAGPLGLLHLMLAKRCGVRQVIIAEVEDRRRALAADFGPDLTLNPMADGLRDVVFPATGGQGVDLLILATSGRGFDAPLAELISAQGRVLFFSGLPEELAAIGTDVNQCHYREWEMVGSYGCTARSNQQAVALLAEPSFPAGRLITQRIGLGQVADQLTGRHIGGQLKTIMEV
jgi:L-iditol 2-dehydrogenase